MLYPYRCPECGPFEVIKSMADAARFEHCPTCSRSVENQDYSVKRIGGCLSTEGNWSGGKMIPQLPANHPDHMVTSKRQMEQVYQKHGISMDTGKFKSKAAQINATVPRHLRTGNSVAAVGGLDDQPT